MGVTYAITDSLTLEAASVAAEGTFASNTDYKYDESAYGIAYTVASGVTLTASYSDFTQSGGGGTDVSGSGTMVEVISFFLIKKETTNFKGPVVWPLFLLHIVSCKGDVNSCLDTYFLFC